MIGGHTLVFNAARKAGVAGGPPGPVSRAAAARAVAWCEYLQGHARRLYASVTDQARVAAAVLATQLAHGRLPSPFTARDVYRNEWTGLTEPRVVQGALEGLAELGWIRAEAVRARDGGEVFGTRDAKGGLLAYTLSLSAPPGQFQEWWPLRRRPGARGSSRSCAGPGSERPRALAPPRLRPGGRGARPGRPGRPRGCRWILRGRLGPWWR